MRIWAMLCAALITAACAGGRSGGSADAVASGPRVYIGFEAGPAYQNLHWSGILPITVRPQMAVWLETSEGRFVRTLSVSDKSARDEWIGTASRPEALPVWRAASAGGTGAGAAADAAADAVSGATPAGSAERATGIPQGLMPGEYVVKLEANTSFDYNAAYPETDKRTGVNGQPSLVYGGKIAVGKSGSRAELVPIGTGSLDGSDGGIKPGVDGLTTALEMILHPFAEYRE
jgi:hypothetical protein